MDLKGRAFALKKTDLSNYDNLRETQRSLSRPDSSAKMNARRSLSRKCKPSLTQSTSTPLMSKGQSPRYSQGPFLVGEYNKTADGFNATSTVQADEVFLGYQIRNGTMGPGDIVRGWHKWGATTGWLEPNPRGREFPPIVPKSEIIEETEELVFHLMIAFTGKGRVD